MLMLLIYRTVLKKSEREDGWQSGFDDPFLPPPSDHMSSLSSDEEGKPPVIKQRIATTKPKVKPDSAATETSKQRPRPRPKAKTTTDTEDEGDEVDENEATPKPAVNGNIAYKDGLKNWLLS